MFIELKTNKPNRYGKVGGDYTRPTWFEPPILCSTPVTEKPEFRGVILNVKSNNLYEWLIYSITHRRNMTIAELVKRRGDYILTCLLLPVKLSVDDSIHWMPWQKVNPYNICGFTSRHPYKHGVDSISHDKAEQAFVGIIAPLVNLLTTDTPKSVNYLELCNIVSRRSRAVIAYEANQKLNMEAMQKYKESVVPISTVHLGDLPTNYKTAVVSFDEKATRPEDYLSTAIKDQKSLKLCLWHTAGRYKLNDTKMPLIKGICGYTKLPDGRPKICVSVEGMFEATWIDLHVAVNRIKGVIDSFTKTVPEYLKSYIANIEHLVQEYIGPEEDDTGKEGMTLDKQIEEEAKSRDNLTNDMREAIIKNYAKNLAQNPIDYEAFLEKAANDFASAEEHVNITERNRVFHQIHNHPEAQDYTSNELAEFINIRCRYNVSKIISAHFKQY